MIKIFSEDSKFNEVFNGLAKSLFMLAWKSADIKTKKELYNEIKPKRAKRIPKHEKELLEKGAGVLTEEWSRDKDR